MLIYGLAIFAFYFNNNTQNGKANFIRKLLNNKAKILFMLIIVMQILHLEFFSNTFKRLQRNFEG
jgi:hypothetical protein